MHPTVLVTGVGGPAGRACAAFFAERGHHVVGADARPAVSPASVFRQIPPAGARDFPEALLELAIHEEAALVVPTLDEEIPIVARMRTAFRRHAVALAISGPHAVDVSSDALETHLALERIGVPVPRTFSGDTPAETVVSALGFPLLSRPRRGGRRGALVHRRRADLQRAGPDEVVWQELLAGATYDVHLFLEHGGHAPAAVVLLATGLDHGLLGEGHGVERSERADVAGLAVRAAQALGLEGPLEATVQMRADGEPVVLKVSPRVGANVLSAREVLEALHDAWRGGRCI
jgi:carbamoyl-phosphate synthase large subunit